MRKSTNDNIKKEWFYPENLKKSELKHRHSKSSDPDKDGDFGSYKSLLETNDIDYSNIKPHNDIYPENKIKVLKIFTDKLFEDNNINSILNLGCGVGFETKVLSEVYNCNVTGVDASYYGIEYAKKNNSNSKTEYIYKTVDSNFLLDKKFDICYAIEFYPFSRTNDLEFQKQIINSIFNNLNENGILVIYQLNTNKWDTLKNNLKKLPVLIKKKIKIFSKLHHKIYKYIPNYHLSKICCLILEKVLKREIGRYLIIIY